MNKLNIYDLYEMVTNIIENSQYLEQMRDIHIRFLRNHEKDENSDDTYQKVYTWMNDFLNFGVFHFGMYEYCGNTHLITKILSIEEEIQEQDWNWDNSEKAMEELVEAYSEDLIDINTVQNYFEKNPNLLGSAQNEYFTYIDNLLKDLRNLKEAIKISDSIDDFDMEMDMGVSSNKSAYDNDHDYGYGY